MTSWLRIGGHALKLCGTGLPIALPRAKATSLVLDAAGIRETEHWQVRSERQQQQEKENFEGKSLIHG